MDFGFVLLDTIDLRDRTFEIRKFGDETGLSRSLARLGILDPPWVCGRGRDHIVVDGFTRLEWARGSGAEGVLCRIFPEGADSRDLWLRRIEGKLFGPDLNLAEKVRIAAVLLGLFTPGDVPRYFFDKLRIPPRPEILRAWAGLAELPPELLEILASGAIAERAALETAGWDPESRAILIPVLRDLRCSASIQAEIAERASEIAIREETGRTDVLSAAEFRDILLAKDMNHRQKTQAIRDYLGRLRYPRLRARERGFQEALGALGLPPCIRIVPPPAFEGNGWRMELTFTGRADLMEAVEAAGDLVRLNRLDPLLRTGGVPPGEPRKC